MKALAHPGLAVLLGAFLTLFGVGGVRQVFGVFLRPIEADLAGDRAQIALVAGLAILVFGLGQPLAGRLVDTRGPGRVIPVAVFLAGTGAIVAALAAHLWQFALFYGVLAAAGFAGAANGPLSAAVARRFQGRRGLALGLCSAGTPLAQLILAPTAGALMAASGWRVALGTLGGAILLLVLPLAWLCLRRESAPAAERGQNAPDYWSAIRSRPFLLLSASYFICGFTTLGLVHTHLVAYAADLGATEAEGARLLGLVGLFNVVGLVLAGHAGDRWGPRLPLAAVYGARSLALLGATAATTPSSLVWFIIVFGLSDMATIPLTASATANCFGRSTVGGLFGLVIVAHQLGAAAGASLAGVVYTVSGSYQPAYVLAALLASVASALSLALPKTASSRGSQLRSLDYHNNKKRPISTI